MTAIWFLLFNKKELLYSASQVDVRDINDLRMTIKKMGFSCLANVQALDLVVWAQGTYGVVHSSLR